jgi:branched-subunit amino acid ABC-type transport system permease component
LLVIELLGQAIVQGLVFGSIYAIAAIGFGLVYHTTGVFHIAYGAILVLGTYVVVTLGVGLPPLATLGAGVAGALVAIAVSLAVYVGVYLVLERRGASSMIVFVASLGVSMVIQAAVLIVFGAAVRNFEAPELIRVHFAGGVGISYLGIATITAGAVVLMVVLWLMNRTRWGFQVQALASNRLLAEGIGIRPWRVIVTVYSLAATLSVVAGVLLGMTTSVVAPMGTNLALMAAIAVLMGGSQSYLGAYAGGLIIGVFGAVAATLLPGEWGVTAVFSLFLVVILLRPRGLLSGRYT